MHEQKGESVDVPSLCASFSKAVSEMLVPRTMQALKESGYQKLAIAGGVAANSRIRADFKAACESLGAALYTPPLSLCGDNGAMISSQGYYEFLAGTRAGQDLNAFATRSIEQRLRIKQSSLKGAPICGASFFDGAASKGYIM